MTVYQSITLRKDDITVLILLPLFRHNYLFPNLITRNFTVKLICKVNLNESYASNCLGPNTL